MSLHADAASALTSWDPSIGRPTGEPLGSSLPRQVALRDRFLTHLQAHPDGMRRSCFPAHLTAGVLVLSSDLDRVLLNLHRKAGRWFAFGGHCEPGDDTLAGAALREGLEESGLPALDLDPVPVHLDEHVVGFCDPRGPVHHLDVRFTALAPADAAHAASEESLAVRWWPVDALPEGLEDEMHELVALSRSRWRDRPEQRRGGPQSTWPSLSGGSTSVAADQPSR